MKKYTILLVIVFLIVPLFARAPKEDLNIIFIGNSITYGAYHEHPELTAPPVFTAKRLARMTGRKVNYRSCGVSGATTSDFLPEPHTQQQYFRKVEKAIREISAISSAPIIFSIMLGTNDSACYGPTDAPVSNELYEQNLETIMDKLRELSPGCVIILHRPLWYSPNTFNGAMYLKAGLERMNGYLPVIEKLINKYEDVWKGSFDAYDYFEKYHERFFIPEDGNAGTFYLHPTPKGAAKLAYFWSKSIFSITTIINQLTTQNH